MHVFGLKPYILSLLFLFCLAKIYCQKNFKFKYQDWSEDEDRIKVRSWYVESNIDVGKDWKVGVTGMVDSISGATPIGRPPSADKSEWLAELNEKRKAGLVNLYKEGEQFNYSLELGLSDEPDYLSRSYAGQISRGFAEDTLVLTSGFSYMDDNVDSGVPGGPSLGILSKRTKEVMIGLYRMINPTSSVSLNLTYGRPEGYLSDPYKQIGLTETLFPGDPVLERDVFYLYPENRPHKRHTFTAYIEGKKYFENIKSTLETSYRIFADDSDLIGHTFELKWIQRISDSFIIQPSYRFYTQSQADFYKITLDGTGVNPVLQPGANDPHYSADYRLSKFHSNTLGLKLIYFLKPDLSFDISYDRYFVSGKDGITDQRVYPDAQVATLGMQWDF